VYLAVARARRRVMERTGDTTVVQRAAPTNDT
jgi:hypothetical protein